VHRHPTCFAMWVESGGNIHDGCHDQDLITSVASMPGQHPCIHVTKASLSLMQRGSIPRSYRMAFRDPRGRKLAERMIPAFTDPVHMGIWIQAMGDHRSG
jgi:hypothetical protein